MNYVVIDLSARKIANWAVLFGKSNIKKVQSNDLYNLYVIEYDGNTFYIPIPTAPTRQLKYTHLKLIQSIWPEFETYTKIVSLPDTFHHDAEYTDDLLIEHLHTIYPSDTIYIHLSFAGDPSNAVYTQTTENKIRYLSSSQVGLNSRSKTNGLHLYDLKLCIAFFYYKHLLSLANPKYLESFQSKELLDKVFIYGRRMDEPHVAHMRTRGYFLKKMKSILPDDMIEFGDLFTMEVEGYGLSFGLYHFGNYIDYNSCMFNVVNETIFVDSQKDRNSCWISEKSVFAILFATPTFLLANQEILDTYKEMGIVLLNDEYDTPDIGDKFEMFCNFINDSTPEQRTELYNKHRIIQNRNREILLNYIDSPKTNCIEYLLN